MRVYRRHDYSQMASWYQMRNRPAPPKWMIPKHGVIVDGVAAGFLVVTNNHMGILEFYTSNPFAEEDAKQEAFDAISHVLILSAKRMGLKLIRLDTKYESLKARAIRFGFKDHGDYSTFSRGL